MSFISCQSHALGCHCSDCFECKECHVVRRLARYRKELREMCIPEEIVIRSMPPFKCSCGCMYCQENNKEE
jgi:hypothetical protein